MKETKGKSLRKSKGITLVALVVTIVILIILATISVSAALGENGLIKQAQDAKKQAEDSIAKEESDMNLLAQEYVNIIAGKEEEQEKPLISITTNYVGYYANLDEDPEPEGVIYADLAKGKKGDGQWGGKVYDIPKETGLKGYYVSKTGHSGKFGTKDVLTATGTGKPRFYVMALEDIDASLHNWYCSANENMSDYATATSPNFGTGKINTDTMMKKWEGSKYGPQSANDMWGLIKTQVSQGWFVPSIEEWAAFAEELSITNFKELGLGMFYWSSSQVNYMKACYISFLQGDIGSNQVDNGGGSGYNVRLSTTF